MSDFGPITTSLDSFVALVSPHVPGAPRFLKEQALRQALDDFFKKTRSWRETVTDIPLYAGDVWVDANDLARQVSEHALAYAVDQVMDNEDKVSLTRLDIEEMDRRASGWLSETADEPSGYLLYEDRRMRVYPSMADDADEFLIDVELVLTCDMEISVVPDFVMQFHREAIVHDAAFRLLSQTGKPWTSPEASAMVLAMADGHRDADNLERAKRAIDAANDRARRRFFG